MGRISYAEYEKLDAESKKAYDGLIKKSGLVTNMKKTLFHSFTAFRAYQEFYPLEEEVKQFLGERGVEILCYSISTQNECVLCSTYFRRTLIERGENPEKLVLDEKDNLIAQFGSRIAKNSTGFSEEFFEKLKKYFNEKEIVLLTAFAGIMAATNIFNNTLEVEVDDHLKKFRK
jgi:alkylhydroperoxidase family enzyme